MFVLSQTLSLIISRLSSLTITYALSMFLWGWLVKVLYFTSSIEHWNHCLFVKLTPNFSSISCFLFSFLAAAFWEAIRLFTRLFSTNPWSIFWLRICSILLSIASTVGSSSLFATSFLIVFKTWPLTFSCRVALMPLFVILLKNALLAAVGIKPPTFLSRMTSACFFLCFCSLLSLLNNAIKIFLLS